MKIWSGPGPRFTMILEFRKSVSHVAACIDFALIFSRPQSGQKFRGPALLMSVSTSDHRTLREADDISLRRFKVVQRSLKLASGYFGKSYVGTRSYSESLSQNFGALNPALAP